MIDLNKFSFFEDGGEGVGNFVGWKDSNGRNLQDFVF